VRLLLPVAPVAWFFRPGPDPLPLLQLPRHRAVPAARHRRPGCPATAAGLEPPLVQRLCAQWRGRWVERQGRAPCVFIFFIFMPG